MTTLRRIAEQIQRLYEAGDPSSDSPLEFKELYLLITQEINRRLKLEHFNVHLPLGEAIPPHASLATYSVNLADPDNVEKDFSCTEIPIAFDVDFWTAPNGEYYLDPETGYYWLNAGEAGVLSVNATGDSYQITLSGVTAYEDTSFAEMVDFITSDEVGYIEFLGITGTNVKFFDIAGISNVQEESDGFSFVYQLNDTIESDEEIKKKITGTHLALKEEEGNINVEVVGLRKCILSVTASNAKATITLPAQPINLPRGMGVWRVYSSSDPFNQFIPLSAGEYFIYDSMLSESFVNLNTYEYFDNKTLVFNKTVSELPDEISIQLVVVSPDKVAATDLLPVPPDMEMEVIQGVLQLLGRNQMEDNLVNDNPNIR